MKRATVPLERFAEAVERQLLAVGQLGVGASAEGSADTPQPPQHGCNIQEILVCFCIFTYRMAEDV